jgi:TolA-binding protein
MSTIKPGRSRRIRLLACTALALGVLLLGTPPAPAQVTADQAAAMLLNSARKAYNEHNYPFAAARFREFLARYGGHKEAPSARYGLALALLDGPDKDHAAAADQLQPLANDANFPERPFALYYLGLARRGQGVKELALAKPQDLPQRRAVANQRFDEAARLFETAGKAFAARVPKPDPTAKQLPVALEWAARARCDQAEMQLRLTKAKEARDTAAPFLKDALLRKSRYRGLGLYYHGFACFLLKDYPAAGKSLNMLTPFTDSAHATHARYLLGRVHHLQEELAEAGAHYEGVLSDYEKYKKAAAEALRQPDRFKNDPDEKARLEALVRDPPPEHVARAAFFSGELFYAGGRFADALTRFAAFEQQYPKSALRVEAQLRQGFCQVQLRQFAEALKVLQPLADREPRLADQALLWVGKAQAGAADPNNAQAYAQALRTAMDTFRRAADRAQQLVNTDPEARLRRGEILLELADTEQQARLFKEAANTCGRILDEKLLPERGPEVMQRQATALHLASDYNASDQVCQRFRHTYPRSPLLAAVLFRHAENAYFQARAAEKNPNLPDRDRTLARLYDEAANRYQVVVEKFPEFTYVNHARYGRGLVFYRKGDYDKARKALEGIAQADRNGDLALTPYLLADCLMRLAPARADDALAAGKLQEQLQAAAELLDGFVNAEPKAEQAPDALLKLGLCQQRLAGLLAKPEDRTKGLQTARATYEKLISQFPKHALQPQAVFERARCLAQAGDKQGAINECRRFSSDTVLKAAPVAPMALLQLAVLLREQNKAEEAARVLDDCRKQHEQNLLRDRDRAGWVVLLQYHQGVALREAGKFAAARDVFDNLIRQFPNRPEAAEAALRRGQCLKDEAALKIEAAEKKLAAANLKPPELADARKQHEEGMRALQGAVQYLVDQANQLKPRQPALEVRARMLYDAAWGYRRLAGPEIAAARAQLQQTLLKKMQEDWAKKNPNRRPPAVLAPPEVPPAAIKVQPSEDKARAQYKMLIADFPDLPLASAARLELAELHAERNEHDAAITLLDEALDKEPPAELTDRIRIRLGTCYAAKQDVKAALAQFDAVAQNPQSPLAGQAHYRAGECLLALKDYAKAAARLAVFRDQPPFQNLPGLTDRALLRLGHALEHLKDWERSRQAHEQVVGRFGNSPWVHEARYGIAYALQNQKQYDNAVNVYNQVIAATATETAARAQFQIGLCRLEQKRYGDAATAFLVVPFTYDYPEWSAAALVEAARTLVEDKKPRQAETLLRRVLKDHPKSKWAEVAQERLEALKQS